MGEPIHTRIARTFGLVGAKLALRSPRGRSSNPGAASAIDHLSAVPPPESLPTRRDRVEAIDAPLSYVVLSATDDIRASILAIRAFALAGRWGDRLTLHGCAARYGKLRKWTRALRIDGAVSFVECERSWAPDYGVYDVAIVACRAGRSERVPTAAFDAGVRIIALDRDLRMPGPLDRDPGSVFVPANDLHQLIEAMLMVRLA